MQRELLVLAERVLGCIWRPLRMTLALLVWSALLKRITGVEGSLFLEWGKILWIILEMTLYLYCRNSLLSHRLYIPSKRWFISMRYMEQNVIGKPQALVTVGLFLWSVRGPLLLFKQLTGLQATHFDSLYAVLLGFVLFWKYFISNENTFRWEYISELPGVLHRNTKAHFIRGCTISLAVYLFCVVVHKCINLLGLDIFTYLVFAKPQSAFGTYTLLRTVGLLFASTYFVVLGETHLEELYQVVEDVGIDHPSGVLEVYEDTTSVYLSKVLAVVSILRHTRYPGARQIHSPDRHIIKPKPANTWRVKIADNLRIHLSGIRRSITSSPYSQSLASTMGRLEDFRPPSLFIDDQQTVNMWCAAIKEPKSPLWKAFIHQTDKVFDETVLWTTFMDWFASDSNIAFDFDRSHKMNELLKHSVKRSMWSSTIRSQDRNPMHTVAVIRKDGNRQKLFYELQEMMYGTLVLSSLHVRCLIQSIQNRASDKIDSQTTIPKMLVEIVKRTHRLAQHCPQYGLRLESSFHHLLSTLQFDSESAVYYCATRTSEDNHAFAAVSGRVEV